MKRIFGSAMAAAVMGAMAATGSMEPVDRPVKIKNTKRYPSVTHQSTRQRARYARQVAKGQIRNAVCAWWAYDVEARS